MSFRSNGLQTPVLAKDDAKSPLSKNASIEFREHRDFNLPNKKEDTRNVDRGYASSVTMDINDMEEIPRTKASIT